MVGAAFPNVLGVVEKKKDNLTRDAVSSFLGDAAAFPLLRLATSFHCLVEAMKQGAGSSSIPTS
jgi:hypothetical protein